MNSADSIQTRHVLSSSSADQLSSSAKNKEEEEALLGRLPDRPPSAPERPFLAPRPDVILMTFSSVDMDSFVECETEIWPEVADRFPLVPVILVALKCDLKESRGTSIRSADSNRYSVPNFRSYSRHRLISPPRASYFWSN